MNNHEYVTFTIFDKISKERPKLFLNSYCYYSIIYLSHIAYYQNEKLTSFHLFLNSYCYYSIIYLSHIAYYQNEKLTSFHHKKEALLISGV